MQRDDPENSLLYRKLEVHVPFKHSAGPSKGEELNVQYRVFIRFVWRSKSCILLRPDLPAEGRQVLGQITDQVIELKQSARMISGSRSLIRFADAASVACFNFRSSSR
jgi:hypothetical protein